MPKALAQQADDQISERDYPQVIVPVNHIEPVPRRIRAVLAGEVVLDTIRAQYVWESPNYPQYYIPVADVNPVVLVDEQATEHGRNGTVQLHGLRVGETYRPRSVRMLTRDAPGSLAGTARFDWNALDGWFEEDEEVFVHPRNPYTRVDAVRSTRHVRVAVGDTVLAETSSPVMVFETGLPTRYYVNRTEVHFENLLPTDTVTACPYKGHTTGYWRLRAGGATQRDVAWTYDFPTQQLLPIAGLIAFYNERVDISVDGIVLPRPTTQFSDEQ
jgi:uncharacterized protein (DUF427 family)